MASEAQVLPGEYVLATGAAAVDRLHILHKVYSPEGRRFLVDAGLKPGMKVADFGCGVGVVSRMLATLVGESGHVTGIDLAAPQVEQARALCNRDGLRNTTFLAAPADATGLPSNTFDLVYCRFLLLHVPDPVACLHEMRRVLKPGGVLVIEDGDLCTASSVPPTSLDLFAELFSRLGPIRGVDYSIAPRLFHLVTRVGFVRLLVRIHQPAGVGGDVARLLKMSVEEAGPAFIQEGLITPARLNRALADMQEAFENPDVLALGPKIFQIAARK
jgi:SAM-dependent methyltransferase